MKTNAKAVMLAWKEQFKTGFLFYVFGGDHKSVHNYSPWPTHGFERRPDQAQMRSKADVNAAAIFLNGSYRREIHEARQSSLKNMRKIMSMLGRTRMRRTMTI